MKPTPSSLLTILCKTLFILTLTFITSIASAQTFVSGDITGDMGNSRRATIADFNNDGFDDIYVTNFLIKINSG